MDGCAPLAWLQGGFSPQDLSGAVSLCVPEPDLGAVPAQEFRQKEVKAAVPHRI